MKLLVLDGNSILNRAFYGIKLLSTKDVFFTNGIYGFLTMLGKIESDVEPDGVAIAFDLSAPTFRHKAYDGYKAKRKGMPDELAVQLPVLKELLGYLGYNIVESEGFEADDVLGTLAAACENTEHTCILATGDRDSLQLVTDKTNVRLVTTKFGATQTTLYTPDKVKEEYGVEPIQLIDIKAIQGDSSDNIPGVAGIGPKGATQLIQKFDSLENVYKNIDSEEIKANMRKKLIADKESAHMSFFLGTIVKNVPVNTDIEKYKLGKINAEKAKALMTKLELFSLIDKVIPDNAEFAAKESKKLSEIKKYEDGAAVLTKLEDFGRADFVFEYEGERINRFAFKIDKIIYDVKYDDAFFTAFCKMQIPKRTNNTKALYKSAKAIGCEISDISFDTELAAYLINPSSNNYDIQRLSTEYSITLENHEEKLYSEASGIGEICDILLEKLEEYEQKNLFYEIELPLAEVLAEMENIGFYVDRGGIEEYSAKLKAELYALQSEIWELVGYEFNINSPKQLGEALFVKLALPHGKKIKSGYSTNAEVLEGLRYHHPAVELVLRYRALAKLNSTYCEGLLKEISTDGRIHSSFNQTETRTGRISSTEPNLQNIPVRTEQGRELRKYFLAKEGCVLVDADYSQIELRVLAHVSNDKNMIEAFKNNSDIHRSTAAQVFNLPESMVTSEMRSRAKAVNFGIVYGIGAFSLSKDIAVTRKEAEQYIDNYLSHYSGVREYMEKTIETAKELGYVQTIFGRRRYLQELSSSNYNLRAFGERVAKNMPIQGAAADIIKIAMVRVYNRLKAEGYKSRLLLQVHDELIVEAYEDEAEVVSKLLVEEMKNAAVLKVPLLAEAFTGKSWYDAKG